MADKYIINRHGKIHSIPESLLVVARAAGGRLATDEELAAAGLINENNQAEPEPKPKASKRRRA